MKNLYQLPAFLWNTLVVYAAYAICRLTFLLVNMGIYEGTSASHLASLFGAGLLFDTSAIIYTNALMLLLFMLPRPGKETTG